MPWSVIIFIPTCLLICIPLQTCAFQKGYETMIELPNVYRLERTSRLEGMVASQGIDRRLKTDQMDVESKERM